jgi:hypothetical protein
MAGKLDEMSILSKIIYSIIFIILLVISSQTIFQFFDIGFDKYGNFLLWAISLIIFFAILPSRAYAFD